MKLIGTAEEMGTEHIKNSESSTNQQEGNREIN